MTAQTADPARVWKDHRRECGLCDVSRPDCPEGREIYGRLQAAHQARLAAPEGVPLSLHGTRMSTAFVWGFWFTIGAGLAATAFALAWIVLWAALLAAALGDG